MAERAISQASVAGLSELETSKVLRNTYLLLSMTLAFSALTAGVSVMVGFTLMNRRQRIGPADGVSIHWFHRILCRAGDFVVHLASRWQ